MSHESGYPLRLSLRIDWSEMDLFGHINNVSYFKYIQAARVAFWAAIGIDAKPDAQGLGALLAATGCQFRKPLFFPGTVHLESRLQFIKTTSFGIQHRLLNDHGELAAEAEEVIVVYDFRRNCKAAIPEAMRVKALALQ